jgi:hypothetical protein
VWIDTKRGAEVISYLCSMAQLYMMDKEKREEERAQKYEKAHRVKEAFGRGGEQARIKGKWSHLNQV